MDRQRYIGALAEAAVERFNAITDANNIYATIVENANDERTNRIKLAEIQYAEALAAAGFDVTKTLIESMKNE